MREIPSSSKRQAADVLLGTAVGTAAPLPGRSGATREARPFPRRRRPTDPTGSALALERVGRKRLALGISSRVLPPAGSTGVHVISNGPASQTLRSRRRETSRDRGHKRQSVDPLWKCGKVKHFFKHRPTGTSLKESSHFSSGPFMDGGIWRTNQTAHTLFKRSFSSRGDFNNGPKNDVLKKKGKRKTERAPRQGVPWRREAGRL